MNPSPPDPVVIPDLVEPIIAWRSWNWDKGTRKYTSIYFRQFWLPGEKQEATCEALGFALCPKVIYRFAESQRPADIPGQYYNGFAVSPTEQHTCGIYATKSFWRAVIHGQYTGRVKLWGKVVEHEWGYRAQYAEMVGRPVFNVWWLLMSPLTVGLIGGFIITFIRSWWRVP